MCCEIYAARARCAYDTHAQTNRSLELSHRCLLSLLSRVGKEGSREKSSRRSAHAAQGSIYPRAVKPQRASTSVAAWIIVGVESPGARGLKGDYTHVSCGETAAFASTITAARPLQPLHGARLFSGGNSSLLMSPAVQGTTPCSYAPPHAALLAGRPHHHFGPGAWG